jgi:hypothetical protein
VCDCEKMTVGRSTGCGVNMLVVVVLACAWCLIAERDDRLMLHTEDERPPTDLNIRLLNFRAASAFRSHHSGDGLIS